MTRTIKDLYPRYRTMRGQFCERKGGWDTHGLPVEVEVCKELGIHSKAEIEAFKGETLMRLLQKGLLGLKSVFHLPHALELVEGARRVVLP